MQYISMVQNAGLTIPEGRAKVVRQPLKHTGDVKQIMTKTTWWAKVN